jgi:FlaA1/EpsC-like NDP-sugar epimerase
MMAHAAVMQSTRARRVVICGAGERGRLLAREMLANPRWHMKPVGFIDSGETSEHSLLGVRVVGKIDDLQEVLERLRVDEAVFSGDPLDPAQRQRALKTCADGGVVVRDLIFEMRETGRNVHGSSVA